MVNFNLFELKDEYELSGNWWNLVRTSNFGFASRIPDLASFDAEKDDILIHKVMVEEDGRRFPELSYIIIGDDRNVEVTNKRGLSDLLARKFVEYIEKNEKIPFNCLIRKSFKDGSVQIKYKPTKYDEFTLKISSKNLKVDDLAGYLEGLKSEEKNPLEYMNSISRKKTTQTQLVVPEVKSNQQPMIKSENQKINDSDLEAMIKSGVQTEAKSGTPSSVRSGFTKLYDETISKVAGSNENRVYVIKAEILNITERSYTYEEDTITYYLVHVKGGQVTRDSKKATQRFNFDEINVRSSSNAMIKFDLNVGDIISFKGKLKSDNFSGDVIKNVRKFTKV